jgi:hypothetical protein
MDDEALSEALARAGIRDDDLIGLPLPCARSVILDRLRAAGFDGHIDNDTLMSVAIERINAWANR